MSQLVHIGLVAMVLFSVSALVAVTFLPDMAGPGNGDREMEAHAFIRTLEESTVMYYTDHGFYPFGKGQGSEELAKALAKAPFGRAYLDVRPDMLTARGDFRSPIDPGLDIVYYRNNNVDFPGNRFDVAIHNKRTFDLWCRSSDGRQMGVNNWTAFTLR